ncbi:TetR/AcrR family transcriptional regulator [Nocardia sp. BMG111209]|uniref:TetR/AcrR family transcriptional regulator n=1 Tax=Nocardia sp. BMG111209 TaxID=1160137 RepID=UPI000370297D|nr:TetR/AcrR family transcriptional regulator [Nocardia sp. BMG111209]
MSPRHSLAEAARTRDRIVGYAVAEASRVGLEGLTIGTLADGLGMSKSGIVGPFGSREQLQIEALDRAGGIFRAAVIEPVAGLPAGPDRLARLIDAWIGYLADCPFPGGCFVTAASTEFDGRPGPLRDHLRTAVTTWRSRLSGEIAAARVESAHRSPDEAATVLIGISMAVNQEIQLLDEPDAAERGRAAMRAAVGLPQ